MMPKFYRFGFLSFFSLLSYTSFAQTILHGGDIIVLTMATNMSPCSTTPLGDEISFVCFQDIETGTEIDITDNGWEHTTPNRWGDSEGTLRLTRTGGVIPRGTVITLQGQITGGVWTYRTLAPDNLWSFTNLNVPGGPFNLDPGGEQIYFMQGGTWDNQGGGANKATYDGRIIFGANNLDVWNANATINHSNLHPDVSPCYYNIISTGLTYMNFLKYTGPTTAADHFEWLKRAQNPSYWTTFNTCVDFNSWAPNYVGASIPIIDNMSIECFFLCDVCPPFDVYLTLNLPLNGVYNVVYTNGIDTLEALGVVDQDWVVVTVTEDVTYWLISVEEVGGCILYSNFYEEAFINTFFSPDAGEYREWVVCPSYTGTIQLFALLNGTPDPGGVWSAPHTPVPFGIWVPGYGPGLYTYWLPHPHGSPCHPPYDSASVRIVFVDDSLTTVDVGCSVNGTPNYIYDDQIEITLNYQSTHAGPFYNVSISSGTITPTMGQTGVPTVFTLSAGSALGPNLVLTVTEAQSIWCTFTYPIIAPGFCSDPCDYDMTATVSGDQDICVLNCPDDPALITIDIQGGTPPYKMDFTLAGNNQQTWNFNGISIYEFQEIEICVDSVPAPIYNSAASLLTLPVSAAGTGLVFTLQSVYDKFDCDGQLLNDELFFNIHKRPAISTFTLNLCRDEALQVDLTEYDSKISVFLDVTWYDGNPFFGGEEILNPTGANLENINQLWAKVSDDYCENSIQVPFKIFPQPKLDSIPPIAVCQGVNIVLSDILINDAGNSNPVYTFHGSFPPDSTNVLDTLFYIPADSTTIYVLAIAGMCTDTLAIEIFVEDYPDFSLVAQPCDLLLNTYSILFNSNADSVYSTLGMVLNYPTGQDTIHSIPNDTDVSIEIYNSSGLCADTLQIVAPNCNCPQITQPVALPNAYSVCAGAALPQMAVSVGSGLVANWYSQPSGGVAFLQNSLTFTPANPVNATFYVEAFDPGNNCYSVRTALALTVHPKAVLQDLNLAPFCENETINFNTLAPTVLNGLAGIGSWFNLTTHLPVLGIVQPVNGASWYYQFTTNAGSCLSYDTVTAIVNPLPDIDLFDIVCDDVSLTYVLEFTSDAENILVSAGNLIQVIGTDSFSLQDIPYDTPIQIDLQNTSTGCSVTFLQPAPDCSCPQLLDNNSFHLCSAAGSINLSTFVGPGVNGTWELVSTPPGGNPGTLTGSVFQGLNGDPGTYELQFIRSVILADCIDTASFTLTLSQSPFADAGIDATVCAPDQIILAGIAGGITSQFSWQTNGGGLIANPLSLNTTYTPTLNDITAGTVSFTLTATDPSGNCPSASETINITIDASAYYIIEPGAQTYCDTADMLVDMDALISYGNTGGVWFFPDTVGAPVVGSSQINPSTLTAGSYTIFYTTSNAVAPCSNDTTGVNLIIQNCACPSVAISSPAQGICSESDMINLNTLLITGEPGSWSIVSTPPGSKPAGLTGTQFSTNQSDAGIYVIRFTLSNPVSGCPSFAEVDLEVIATPKMTIVSVNCATDLQSWQAVITSTSANLNNSLGTVSSLGGNQYLIENITLLTPLLVTASSTNGLCSSNINIPAPDCACTISISNLPDKISICPDESIVLEGQVNDPKGTATSFWIVANDTLYQNSLQVTQAGIYQFSTFDALGCKAEHEVEVLVYQEMVVGVNWLDINCPGDKNGEIVLTGIAGGNAPYMISVNGSSLQQINSFPHILNGLSAGMYHLELLDGFGCSTELDIEINSASSETIDLGPDQVILAGDSLLINPLLSFIPDTFYWTGDPGQLLKKDQLMNWVHPETDQLFQLHAIDDKGCLYSDFLKIRVLLESSIIVPNIFSPNGDGINDLVFPKADPSITSITFFEIFSRWGELVHASYNFPPNDASFGWDGYFNQEQLIPAVFVYRIGAVNKRGAVITKYGDITLMR